MPRLRHIYHRVTEKQLITSLSNRVGAVHSGKLGLASRTALCVSVSQVMTRRGTDGSPRCTGNLVDRSTMRDDTLRRGLVAS